MNKLTAWDSRHMKKIKFKNQDKFLKIMGKTSSCILKMNGQMECHQWTWRDITKRILISSHLMNSLNNQLWSTRPSFQIFKIWSKLLHKRNFNSITSWAKMEKSMTPNLKNFQNLNELCTKNYISLRLIVFNNFNSSLNSHLICSFT